ncbi:hypothetical protein B0T13DRAFT_512690 [Neurospora crassa]|nr:hypothetical protein B0T13DRAFT_512690 [Neurospora crassa]
MLTPIPRTYPDPDPGVWTTAIQAFISVLGQDAVLIDSALSGYIAPYDLCEAESGKNMIYGGPTPRVNGSVALDSHRID